jgi:signal transduction histidine kinase/DNA-binding response OmpR family regulator
MRHMLRNLPIARKLGLLLAFNTTIAVVAIALVFSLGTAISRYQDARNQLLALSEVMGETSRAALAFNDKDGARAVLMALRARLEISQATLTDRRGAVFTDLQFDATHPHVGSLGERVVYRLFPATMAVSHTIVDDGVPIGRIELVAHLYHIWLGLLKSLGGMVVIGVALSALAAHFGMRLRSIVVDPILGLAKASYRVSTEQDYSIRAVKTGEDEVGLLVDDFNRMLAEIQQRDEALKQEHALLESRVAQRTADLQRAVEEARQANRVKSEFLSTVSHELRTPLTAIGGSIGLLSGGAMGALPTEVMALLEIAQKNSQRLSQLINDLLDVEKLMAGKLHFDLLPHELMPIVEQAIAENQSYAEQYQVVFSLTEHAEGLSVEVDALRLHQVLANLLSNAAKFSPAGGVVEVGVRSMGERVRVFVKDRGPGIPAAFQGRIFEKFAQADASDVRKKGGTGLGLAITRELVERMGGSIGFETVPGQGSCFFFDLPVWQVAPTSSLVDLLPAPLPGALRILVVEDDLDIAHMLRRMLERAGYGVDFAADGAQALQHLEQTRYAAMTLDLVLPDMRGEDLVRTLRARPATVHLPILVISARVDEGQRALGERFEGVEWLAKPIVQSRLLALMAEVVPSQPLPHCRILHVEDDVQLHQTVLGMTEGRYDFELATSLREARARIALERFDVVLLDIGLPNASGWDLLTDIRTHQPQTRVVVLTGGAYAQDDGHAVDAVLHKNHLSPHQLHQAIGGDQGTRTKVLP